MEITMREQLLETTDIQTLTATSRMSEEIDGQVFPLADTSALGSTDLAAASAIPGVDAVALIARSPVEIRSTDTTQRRRAELLAVTPGFFKLSSFPMLSGHPSVTSAGSGTLPEAIVSKQLAIDLTGGDPGAASGDTVLVGGVHHRIVGVLAGTFGRASRGVVVPFQPDLDRSMRIRALRYPALLVHASRVEDIASIEQAVRARLAPAVAGRTPAVVVQSYRARAEQATQGILVFKLLMGAITGISLLVGGIGIMNVLLASVSERTREIGIRKVAGARHRDILAQFLTESVAITAIGSVLGVMLGLAGAFGVTALIRHLADAVFVRASFSWVSVLIAAAVTIAIGLAFGTYPARRAARLSPIDAIRHD